ncbi:TPA: aspartate 1-decarboxylase [bacterium]|nr:aspartate 1-decarboxylase [bacterium]
MQRIMCRAKIHQAKVTEVNLKYIGSLSVDGGLLKVANIEEYERVQVLNLQNGERFETYVMKAPPGSGTICLNGAAARLGHVGDELIIIAYSLVEEEKVKGFKPKIVFVDEKNQIVRT